MARLKSELEVACPCCQTMLVIDTNLGRSSRTRSRIAATSRS